MNTLSVRAQSSFHHPKLALRIGSIQQTSERSRFELSKRSLKDTDLLNSGRDISVLEKWYETTREYLPDSMEISLDEQTLGGLNEAVLR